MMTRIQDKDRNALLDELLKGCKTPEDILGKGGLLKDISKRLFERALAAELTDHLGREPHARAGEMGTGEMGRRNGDTDL